MDLLGDILSTLELRSSLYFRAELTAPFSIAVPEDRNVIRFHVANEGPCRIELPSGESTDFVAGDLVLVPHGAAHVLSDSPAAKPVRHVRSLSLTTLRSFCRDTAESEQYLPTAQGPSRRCR